MVVPLGARSAAAVVGGLLVLSAWVSVVETLIVPRAIGNWLTMWVDRSVNGVFRAAAGRIADFRRRGRLLAGQAATVLLVQLAAWLGISELGPKPRIAAAGEGVCRGWLEPQPRCRMRTAA